MKLIDLDAKEPYLLDGRYFVSIPNNAPTVEQPQGEWLDVVCENGGFYHGTCSNCKIRNDIPPVAIAHFCPNCGAKMT